MNDEIRQYRYLNRLVLIGALGGCVSLACGGCGSKEADPQTKNNVETQPGALRDRRDERDRHNDPDRKKQDDSQSNRRVRDTNEVRKWASQHLYMDLTLEHLELTKEQLDRLAELNWRHFSELMKKNAEQVPLDAALLKMMTTGVFDPLAFDSDRQWLQGRAALQETQERERLTVLHQTLTAPQRTELAKLVEAEQKKGYVNAASAKAQKPEGCGGQGDRFMKRFTSDLRLSKKQRKKLSTLRREINQHNPILEKLVKLRESQQFFDQVMRRLFVLDEFDPSKLTRPVLAGFDPAAVSECNQREFQLLIETLTAEQRHEVATKLQSRTESRGQGSLDGVVANDSTITPNSTL